VAGDLREGRPKRADFVRIQAGKAGTQASF